MLHMGIILILSVIGMTAIAIGVACRNADRRRSDSSPTTGYVDGGGGEVWNPDCGSGSDCSGGGDGGGGGD